VSFFRSRQPSRKKVPKMTSQSPSGTLPGTRQEGKIGLLVALGAFQGRFWTPKGGPNGTQNRSKIDLGAQGPPKSAQEPPGGPKRPPPEARIRGPPRPTSTRKSYTKILVKRSFQTALRKIHQRSLAQWPVLGAQPGFPWPPLASSGRAWPGWHPVASLVVSQRPALPLPPGLPWPPLASPRGCPWPPLISSGLLWPCLASPGLPSWPPVASPDLLWPCPPSASWPVMASPGRAGDPLT
jgi:hypothetical protein